MSHLSFLLLLLTLLLWSRYLNNDISRYIADSQDIDQYFRRSEEQPTSGTLSQSTSRPDVAHPLVPKPQEGERFIKGPLPLDWMRKAAECGGRGTEVGLLLWYAAGWQKRNPIKLSQSVVRQLPVHQKTCRRVISNMEQLGLIAVDRHKGRSPLVTLLPTPQAYVGKCESS